METIRSDKAFAHGNLIFVKTKFKWWNPFTWLPLIIRIVAKIEYNHVGVIIENYGYACIYEATQNGITVSRIAKYMNRSKYEIAVKQPIFLKSESYDLIIGKKACSNLGVKYDYFGLFVTQLFLNLFQVFIFPKSRPEQKFYCYEFAAYCVGWQNLEKVEPKEFENTEEFETIFTMK